MTPNTFVPKKIRIAAALAAILFLAPFAMTSAQSAQPQFLLTWKTSNSYTPSFYGGKAFPTLGSQVTASLELISQGRLINVSGQAIYWYLNDTLIGGGIGVQKITFQPFGVPPNVSTLRVELPRYPGSYLIHQIQIPMVNPEVVIFAPYPAGIFSISPVVVAALPYFFNATSSAQLSYQWSANNQSGGTAENPMEAQIVLPQGTPAGTNFIVNLTVKSPINSRSGSSSKNLIYQPSL